MIYHVSIEADAPEQVARVLAELMGGIATPFPPVAAGSWIALAGDTRNSAIEVYPRGTQLHETSGDADAHGRARPGYDRARGGARHGSTHVALGVARGAASVMGIAAREGWPAKYRRRGGMFGVIELWVEGCLMIEVLTPEMQREYLESFTVDGWLKAMEHGRCERMAA